MRHCAPLLLRWRSGEANAARGGMRLLLLSLSLALVARAEIVLDKDSALTEKSTAIATGELSETFALPVRDGQLFAVTVTSAAFAPYLIINSRGLAQLDRKGAGDTARLWFVAPRDGLAQLVVTTEKAGLKGKFHIKVTNGLIEGELGPRSAKLDTGELTEVVPVWVTRGEYTVALSSEKFNPYLIIQHGERKTEVDDDVGGGTSARALVAMGEPGYLAVQVTTHAKDERGPYRLVITPGIGDLDKPQSSRGKLEAGDILEDGKWTDSFSFVCAKGKRYTVTLKPTGFTARLVVFDGAGVRHEALAGQPAPEIGFDNGANGTAQIMVQTTVAEKGGEYEVLVTPVAAAPVPPPPPPPAKP